MFSENGLGSGAGDFSKTEDLGNVVKPSKGFGHQKPDVVQYYPKDTWGGAKGN